MENNRDANEPFNQNNNVEPTGGVVSEYIVEERDTLVEIARRYGISIDEIIAANSDIASEPADLVKPGLHLKIPRLKDK